MSIFNLLSVHADNSEITGLIADVLAKPTDYECHSKLKRCLVKHKLDDEHTAAYMDEYHEFMYSNSGIAKRWYKFGTSKSHCTKTIMVNGRQQTLPAVIYDDGDQLWYFDDEFHRTDIDENGRTLPAIIRANGDKSWMCNGKLHRTDKDENGLTLPAIETPNRLAWYKNGEKFRDDKDEHGVLLPTEIDYGCKKWFHNGKVHRVEICTDPDSKHFGKAMPAVIYKSGNESWEYNGGIFTQDELTKLIQRENIMQKLNIVEENGRIKLTIAGTKMAIDGGHLFIEF
jgi:hypothetical protein